MRRRACEAAGAAHGSSAGRLGSRLPPEDTGRRGALPGAAEHLLRRASPPMLALTAWTQSLEAAGAVEGRRPAAAAVAAVGLRRKWRVCVFLFSFFVVVVAVYRSRDVKV